MSYFLPPPDKWPLFVCLLMIAFIGLVMGYIGFEFKSQLGYTPAALLQAAGGYLIFVGAHFAGHQHHACPKNEKDHH